MKRLFVLSLLFVTLLSSCRYFSGKRIRGNGQVKTETRSAGSFTDIDVSGAIDVYVRQDSVSSVKVETDENLLDYVEIAGNGSVLRIQPRKGTNLRPTHGIKVYVSNLAYKQFEASGACNIYGENKIKTAETLSIDLSGASDISMELAAPEVKVDATGAGKATLKGETRDLSLHGTGATDFRCYELLSENCRVRLSGAGEAQVFASVKLDVHVSGAADVKYKGNAAVVQEISGAGSVKKVD